LNIAECMALGKYVIATDYSGNRDFLDETCGGPVSFGLRPVGRGEYPFGEGQWWAEPDLDHAAELLCRAARDADWRMQIGHQAQLRIREQLIDAELPPYVRSSLAA
jgi:hypothetical protein